MSKVLNDNGSSLQIVTGGILPPTSPAARDIISKVEERTLVAPQLDIVTHHVIHAGIYSRTICIPKAPPGDKSILTSAVIKIPTTLVVCGDCSVLIGDAEEVRVIGYHVFAAQAGRQQMYIAHDDTYITMSFKTNAKTVEEAEAEFTDDHERLMSRRGVNRVIITGE